MTHINPKLLKINEVSDRILELIEGADKLTRSDLQGVAEAIAMDGIGWGQHNPTTHVLGPRKPTDQEKAELLDCVAQDSNEDAETIKGFIDDASIVVFDDYITTGPGYHGKVMVVVWQSGPEYTEVFIWESAGEGHARRLAPVEVDRPYDREGK